MGGPEVIKGAQRTGTDLFLNSARHENKSVPVSVSLNSALEGIRIASAVSVRLD